MGEMISPRVAALVAEGVSSGRYKTYGKSITCSPRSVQELDAMIQEGIDDIERGDVYSEEEAREYIAALRAML